MLGKNLSGTLDREGERTAFGMMKGWQKERPGDRAGQE